MAVFLSFISEVLAVFYTFFIREIILFINSQDASITRGIFLLSVFGLSAVLSSLLRNYYYFYSNRIVIKIRKTLILTAYEKLIKLSLQSLFKIKSVKIINFFSSELFSIESDINLIPLILSAPLINIVGYLFIGFNVGWIYAMSTLLLWFFTYVLQYYVSTWQKRSKHNEGRVVQRRLDLVNEFLKNIKSIKCHAFEHLYIDKLYKNRI